MFIRMHLPDGLCYYVGQSVSSCMANQGTHEVAEYIVKMYSILCIRKVHFDMYMFEGSE